MDPIVELLQALAPAVPREMTVVALCDRGLASPKLWRQVLAQGWHPYMRYPKNVTFYAEGGSRWDRSCWTCTSGSSPPRRIRWSATTERTLTRSGPS